MAPSSATLFAFNVGFGDCVLLRFQYADNVRRHVLIDFGSTRQPKQRPSDYLTRIAHQIRDLCGGKLDIVVATHRHKDHIYGFRTNLSGTGPGDVIADCDPTLVLQPWTEHPDAATNATEIPQGAAASMHFAKALSNMDRFSRAIHRLGRQEAARKDFGTRMSKAFSFLGENNIANKSAVRNLMTMGHERRYLCFGEDAGTADILPGVEVDVLGPPTLEQHGDISAQSVQNQEEYWHINALAAGASVDAREEAPIFPAKHLPFWGRWGRYRLRRLRGDMLMQIVRQLDRQMNNTSLILLFTVGNRSLLFPGDAQWENWSYALSKDDIKQKLKSVDVYKVGHHGSQRHAEDTMGLVRKSVGNFGNRPPEVVDVHQAWRSWSLSRNRSPAGDACRCVEE